MGGISCSCKVHAHPCRGGIKLARPVVYPGWSMVCVGCIRLRRRQARKVTDRKSMRKNAEILENGGEGRNKQ